MLVLHIVAPSEVGGLERVVQLLAQGQARSGGEIHVAGVEEDHDLRGPWISPAEPPEEMLDFMEEALARCPNVKAVTYDAFSPALTGEVLVRSVQRIRARL